MTYKKAPSIKYTYDKAQILAKKRAFDEYIDWIYAQHPQPKEAIQQFVKQEIDKK